MEQGEMVLALVRWGGSAVVLMAWVVWLWAVAKAVRAREGAEAGGALPDEPAKVRFDVLDRASLAILAVMALCLWLGRHDLFPIPPDGYYHLRVAREVLRQHTIPAWNSWEFAPIGRPHLYPPMYHVLLAVWAAVAHGGDVLAAFKDVQALVLPFAHFTVWLLARRMFGAAQAFASLLLVGADPLLAVVGLTATPSVLAGAFAALTVLCAISDRWILALSAGVLCALTHMTLLPLTLVGLALAHVRDRQRLARLALVAVVASALVAPWYARVWTYRACFRHPIEMGVYGDFEGWQRMLIKIVWLQLLNLGLVVLAIRAMTRGVWRNANARCLVCLALAYLPILLSYGGRYFAHTVGFWSILAAGAIAPLLTAPRTKRRVGLALFPAIVPTVVVVGFGTVITPGPMPMISAWSVPPAVALGGMKLIENGEALRLVYYDDARAASEYIDANTSPDTILHFPHSARDLSITIGFWADRPIDNGAWEETRPDDAVLDQNAEHADAEGPTCYVAARAGFIPSGARVVQFGRIRVGLLDAPGMGGGKAKR